MAQIMKSKMSDDEERSKHEQSERGEGRGERGERLR